MKKIILFLAVSVSIHLFPQGKYKDSLLSLVEKTPSDTQKINLLLKLCDRLSNDKPIEGRAYAYRAYALYDQKMPQRFLQKTFLRVANSFEDVQENDSALFYYKRYTDLSYNIGDSISFCYGNCMIGSMYIDMGRFREAIQKCHEALKMAERLKNEEIEAIASNNMGNVFYFQEKKEIALKYWLKAVELNRKNKKFRSVATGLSNVAAYYNETGNYKEALKCLYESLDIHGKNNDRSGVANTLINLGLTYSYQGNQHSALKTYFRAFGIADSIKDYFVEISAYNNIGDAYHLLGNNKSALTYFLRADALAIALKMPEGRRTSLFGISELYKAEGDYKKALEYHTLLSNISDSLLNAEMTMQTAEMETKYQTDKKIQENKLLQAQNKVSEGTIQQQRMMSYFIIAGLIFVVIVAIILFRNFRIKKKANIELNLKNELISSQKQIVEHQKELIEEKQKEVMDSIRYAKRIQQSLLATDKYIEKSINRLKSN